MPHVSYTLGDLHAILTKEQPSSVCLVTTRKVASHLPDAIRKIGISPARMIFVPDGEKAKEWPVLEKLLTDFSDLELDRSSIVLILGGGTVGDLAGLAASIYLRGIRYIQIPTTLVAQVDSAHGGKTGINFLGYKNQVGAIHEPVAIIVDPSFVRSLKNPQIIDGLGEIIKCGLIKDISILAILKNERVTSLAQSRQLLSLIQKTIAVKNHYTQKDIHDKGLRNMLNFGHTAGHAIELTEGLSHGYAVILGMLQELSFTESVGLTKKNTKQNLLDLLSDLGILISTKYKVTAESVRHDKKVSGKNILLPVVEKEGKSKLVTMDMRLLKSLFQ